VIESNDIDIKKDKIDKILKKIIIIEKNNIKSKNYNHSEMVKKIKKIIEEEVECY
jgi:hypothetical protein